MNHSKELRMNQMAQEGPHRAEDSYEDENYHPKCNSHVEN